MTLFSITIVVLVGINYTVYLSVYLIRRLPDGSLSTGPSNLDKLSDSQMDKSALNDVEDDAWVSSG